MIRKKTIKSSENNESSLTSDITKQKMKCKKMVFYDLEFIEKPKKKTEDNDDNDSKNDDNGDDNGGDSDSKKTKYKACVLRVERKYESHIDMFIAFVNFISTMSIQLKIFTSIYSQNCVNFGQTILANQSIRVELFPEIMLTAKEHRNLYKKILYELNGKIEK